MDDQPERRPASHLTLCRLLPLLERIANLILTLPAAKGCPHGTDQSGQVHGSIQNQHILEGRLTDWFRRSLAFGDTCPGRFRARSVPGSGQTTLALAPRSFVFTNPKPSL